MKAKRKQAHQNDPNDTLRVDHFERMHLIIVEYFFLNDQSKTIEKYRDEEQTKTNQLSGGCYVGLSIC